MSGGSNNWQVAPHGVIGMAVAALLLIVLVHQLGFRVVGAVKVGG